MTPVAGPGNPRFGVLGGSGWGRGEERGFCKGKNISNLSLSTAPVKNEDPVKPLSTPLRF